MLHIKLPKGKVSQACEEAAEQCSRRLAVKGDWYRSALEMWRKEGTSGSTREARRLQRDERGPPPPRPDDFDVLTKHRDHLHQMADMCKHSTGDVYVSPELWNIIKGVY